MEIDIFSNDALIGTSMICQVDPSMGVAGGLFRPSPLYSGRIQQLFREATDTSFGKSKTPLQKAQRQQLLEEIEKLKLSARTKEGKIFDPCAGIDLVDLFDPKTGEDYMEVSLLGLPCEDIFQIPEFSKSLWIDDL
jgi:hypothetical protein